MFTGLVKELGEIVDISSNAEGKVFKIKSPKLISEISVDDSVAVNGCCQTAVKVEPPYFYVQAVHVTLEKTNFNKLQMSDRVNLELALRFSDRLGGHLVQGHVNGVALLINKLDFGKNILLSFKVSENFSKYLMNEGSVAIDGISLTVAKFSKEDLILDVSIIPHTYENTNLKFRSLGEQVNIEVDVIAKYLENLISHKPRGEVSSISKEWLSAKGFL
jgi:riboflavin synthase